MKTTENKHNLAQLGTTLETTASVLTLGRGGFRPEGIRIFGRP